MAYREKKIYAGNYMEVEIYPITLQERKQGRKSKSKISLPKQQKLNEKNAKKHLARLINANFSEGDYHLTLTYEDRYLPKDRKEAERDVRNFFRRLKYRRKKLDLPELKYIAVVENLGKDGRKTRVHHHILIQGDMDRSEVEKVWNKGRCNSMVLKPDEKGLSGLAHYISKNAKHGKKWTQSRNLKQPTVSVNDWKFSKRKVEKLSRFGLPPRELEKIYPGWSVSDAESRYNEIDGGIYIAIFLRRTVDDYKQKHRFGKKRIDEVYRHLCRDYYPV